ncbi:hypothetical protein P43SY_009499 [Pythium insidiosum]|uniref:Temptin Cys/Cys disulfide domain-containing protein n=1 Tax=Pythium insidiosum TaxID=114742 RepID=A0AAD5Q8M4_PYTIN|nr:hypothetical protein P43SY_009499 [Pythium insidiosum]
MLPRRHVVWALVAVVAACPTARAIPAFVGRVPNGDRLPGVDAAGHANRRGGGALNAFGRDFLHIANRSWTKELCERDSDGDGQTNGEELGDPCCLWTRAVRWYPLWDGPVSHPGNAQLRLPEMPLRPVNCSNLSQRIRDWPSAGGSAAKSWSWPRPGVLLVLWLVLWLGASL